MLEWQNRACMGWMEREASGGASTVFLSAICADLVGCCSVLDSKLCVIDRTGASVVSWPVAFQQLNPFLVTNHKHCY